MTLELPSYPLLTRWALAEDVVVRVDGFTFLADASWDSDNLEKFADELAPLDSLPPGNDDSTLKRDFHEETFQMYSNPLFEFDDNFKSSKWNPPPPALEEKIKDVEN
ncbi:hypothetical protein Tco_0289954 [Tanacetum coccineum]